MQPKLKEVRLSKSSLVGTIKFEDGLGGIASVTKDGIPFVVLEFVDETNIFEPLTATRIYLAFDMKWQGASPKELLNYIGKIVPGKFVTKKVLPYINYKPSSYTTFMMPHENELNVFAHLGYTVMSDDGEVLIEAKRQPFVE